MDINTLCILRLSALGDVTHVVPVVAALHAQCPGIQITWVIGKPEHRLLDGLDGVEFLVYDKRSGLAGWRALRRKLARRRFDALLQMQVSLRAGLVSTAIRAGVRVGYDRARARELHGWFVNRRIAEAHGQHVLDALMSFVEPLGLEPDPARWNLPLADDDLAFARDHLDPSRRTLVVCPVSSHPRRNWRPERYAAVADHAIERHGFQVILSGGPAPLERRFGDRILAEMRHPALDLIGKDTPKKLAALVGGADLVLAPDTGPAHIANAAGTPVIGLYAATNPRRSGPYHSLKWCVDRYPQAALKFRGKPAAQLRWGTKLEYPGVMDLISVPDVIERLDAWAAQGPHSRKDDTCR